MDRRLDKVVPKVASGWHATVTKTSAAGSEAKLRGKATYQALKGDLRAPEPASHRKRYVAMAVGAVGAAVSAAYMAVRRRRRPEWLTADITPETEINRPGGQTPSGQAPISGRPPSPGSPAPRPGQPVSARAGDRGGASVDEMIADSAETASSAVTKAN